MLFRSRKLGDPHDFACRYYEQGIDEILYLDTVASLYERNNLGNILERTTADVFIPITAGGGLRSAADVGAVLKAGADKAAVNTAALRRPQLITEIARAYGSQCMVLSIQAKRRDPNRPEAGWEAYYDNGREHSGRDVLEWAKEAVSLGAGEILLSSVDKEGFQRGMDQELIAAVAGLVEVPVIAAGGASCAGDIAAAAKGGADAVAEGSILHYGKTDVPTLKSEVRALGVEVRR